MKKCKYCGTEREGNEQFCPNCGASAVVTEEERANALKEAQEEQRLRNAEKFKIKPRTKIVLALCSIVVVIIIVIVMMVSAISAENNRVVADGKTNHQISQEYDEVKNLYANEKYEEALALIDEIPSEYKNYDDVQNTKNEIIDSYSTATISKVDQYVANEQYSDALSLLTTVLEKTNNYQPLKIKYDEVLSGCKTTYLAKAQSLADKGEYTQAISTLETISSVITSDADIDAKILEYKKAIINNKLSEYEKSEDYASAITYLGKQLSDVSNDVDLTAKLNSYKTTYKENVFTEAETAYKNSGYKEAVQIIDDALLILPNDVDLQNKKTEYNEFAPVELSNIKVTNGDDYFFDDTAYDPRENVYNNVLVLSSYSENWTGYSGKVEFYLNSSYKNFMCTIVPDEDFSTKSKAGSYIKIYTDDELIYTSEKITYKTEGIDVKLNVTGITYLRIEIENTTESDLHTADATTFLANAQVSK